MVDARGLLCPMPLVMVRKELEGSNPDTLEVLVDDAGAKENVTRFAESRGYKVVCTEDNGDYRLVLSK